MEGSWVTSKINVWIFLSTGRGGGEGENRSRWEKRGRFSAFFLLLFFRVYRTVEYWCL